MHLDEIRNFYEIGNYMMSSVAFYGALPQKNFPYNLKKHQFKFRYRQLNECLLAFNVIKRNMLALGGLKTVVLPRLNIVI